VTLILKWCGVNRVGVKVTIRTIHDGGVVTIRKINQGGRVISGQRQRVLKWCVGHFAALVSAYKQDPTTPIVFQRIDTGLGSLGVDQPSVGSFVARDKEG
jgi:hypothetical protein